MKLAPDVIPGRGVGISSRWVPLQRDKVTRWETPCIMGRWFGGERGWYLHPQLWTVCNQNLQKNAGKERKDKNGGNRKLSREEESVSSVLPPRNTTCAT